MKATWVKVNGTWKKIKNVWVKVNGVWKQKVIPKGKILGVWKEFISYVLNWRVEVDMGGYANSPAEIQVDSEGNSYFLQHIGVSNVAFKYSPDGKKLMEKDLAGSVILNWVVFDNYIYYQQLITGSTGPIRRININTFEVESLTSGTPRVDFISVNVQQDSLIVGTESSSIIFYQLSTGNATITQPLGMGYRLLSVEDLFYYTTYFNSYDEKHYINKVDRSGKVVWTYYSQPGSLQDNRIIGEDDNYFYLLTRTVINSTFKWVYTKLKKSDGKAETVVLNNMDYAARRMCSLDERGYFYLISSSGVLNKYDKLNFNLLGSKDLVLGAYKSSPYIIAQKGYLYFSAPPESGNITTQLWGKEELI